MYGNVVKEHVAEIKFIFWVRQVQKIWDIHPDEWWMYSQHTGQTED